MNKHNIGKRPRRTRGKGRKIRSKNLLDQTYINHLNEAIKDYNDCSTQDLWYLWANSVQRIHGFASDLEFNACPGPVGPAQELLLSRLLLETCDAMRMNKELGKREERGVA